MKAIELLNVGDKVRFALQRGPNICEVDGVIQHVIPYGFSAYYVIEYNSIVDFALVMVHHNLLLGPTRFST